VVVIRTVELEEGLTAVQIKAALVTLNAKHVQDYETLWRELLEQFQEADQDISWKFKQQLTTRQPRYEGYAIEYADLTQGMMLLETQNHWSKFTQGKRLVYVESLVSAPWNRITIQRPPEVKGVGRALMLFARQRSVELGYQGRVGLYSLPNVVRFYDQLGMTQLELEPEEIVDAEENLPYFEFMELRPRLHEDN
jgi:GNAT superfamily N-acetyltransferase